LKLELDYSFGAGSAVRRSAMGVTGETETLAELLLASPTYLEPVPCCSATRASLRDGFAVSVEEAGRQHKRLQNLLERHGVRCRMLPPQPGLPDLCFTRDAAVMTWGLLGLNPAMPHRAREVDHVLRFARAAGIPVIGAIGRGTAEGGDICVARPGLVFIGCSGERTDETGAESVAEIFRAAGWEAIVYRFDPHFLHLDTQFCMVRKNLALACTDVLSGAFLASLDRLGIDTIPVTYKEAARLGCNILALGRDRVISSADNSRVNALLTQRGLAVETVDISQFTHCGGGIHCLTMPLARGSAR
jgi:N-dimethylarginine dimethylaminohydrolase